MPFPGSTHASAAFGHGVGQDFGPSPRARLLVPVFVSLLAQLPPALFVVFAFGATTSSLIVLALALLGPVALLAARRYPGPVVVAMALAASVDFLLGSSVGGLPYLALAFAVVGAIVRGARVWAWVSVGIGWAVTLGIGILIGVDWHPARIAVTTLGILIVFGIGESLRSRREHYEEYLRTVAQQKQTDVQAERVRIARELHDVLAHSLSQINVQAGVGLHLMEKQPEKAADALASIKETSKTALDEVRAVLGVLRAEGGQDPSAPLVPEPDLSRLPGLVASFNSQGIEVEVQNSLAEVPPAVQLAMYRIVQESLTNVVRHSGASRASVDLSQTDTDYVISIMDDGTSVTEPPDSTGGRGLIGMRERAELLGGTLELSASSAGGLIVTARLPVRKALV